MSSIGPPMDPFLSDGLPLHQNHLDARTSDARITCIKQESAINTINADAHAVVLEMVAAAGCSHVPEILSYHVMLLSTLYKLIWHCKNAASCISVDP